MNWLLNALVGILGSLFFVSFGAWALWWNLTTASLALDAVAWPTVPGEVVSSVLDRTGEPRPKVTYRYTVDGQTYTSEQLGFDVFHKPGGRGRAATRVERYPVGAAVTVYRNPTDPTQVVLEPGDASPFLFPGFMGALICGLGLFLARGTVHHLRGTQPTPMSHEARVRAVALSTTTLIYAILVIVSFDSGVSEVQTLATGDTAPFGLSPRVFFLLLQTVLFLPMFAAIPHGVTVMMASMAEGRGAASPTRFVLEALRRTKEDSPLATSARIALAGLAYFFVVVALWIAFTAVKGI